MDGLRTFLHAFHRSDDEAWHVLEGSLRFRFADREVDAPAGTTVFVPAGAAHTYRETEPSRYLIFLTPRLDRLIARLHSLSDPSELRPRLPNSTPCCWIRMPEARRGLRNAAAPAFLAQGRGQLETAVVGGRLNPANRSPVLDRSGKAELTPHSQSLSSSRMIRAPVRELESRQATTSTANQHLRS